MGAWYQFLTPELNNNRVGSTLTRHLFQNSIGYPRRVIPYHVMPYHVTPFIDPKQVGKRFFLFTRVLLDGFGVSGTF